MPATQAVAHEDTAVRVELGCVMRRESDDAPRVLEEAVGKRSMAWQRGKYNSL